MEQGQADQTGSYDPIYCYLSFCIHIPIKVEPGRDPLTWEVRFTLHNFLLLLPPSTIQQPQRSCLQEL